MLFLISLQILPGDNGSGVRFAQEIAVILIGVGGCFYLEAQVFLTGFGLLPAAVCNPDGGRSFPSAYRSLPPAPDCTAPQPAVG